MKRLQKSVKDLSKTLNDMHAVVLNDGTYGMCVDWEFRIAVIDVNGKRVISNTDKIARVIRVAHAQAKERDDESSDSN